MLVMKPLFITFDVTIKYGLRLENDLKIWKLKWQDLNPGPPGRKTALCHLSHNISLVYYICNVGNILFIESEYLIFYAAQKLNKIDKISQRICKVHELWADEWVDVRAVLRISYCQQ